MPIPKSKWKKLPKFNEAKEKKRKGKDKPEKIKVYHLREKVYESVLNWTHNLAQIQERLYIPSKGIVGYRLGYKEGPKIDFFSANPELLKKAQAVVDSKVEGKYIGEFDLPEELVQEILELGKGMNETRSEFEEKAKSLVDLIKEN